MSIMDSLLAIVVSTVIATGCLLLMLRNSRLPVLMMAIGSIGLLGTRVYLHIVLHGRIVGRFSETAYSIAVDRFYWLNATFGLLFGAGLIILALTYPHALAGKKEKSKEKNKDEDLSTPLIDLVE